MLPWVKKILSRGEYSAKEVRKAIKLGRVRGAAAEEMIRDFVDTRVRWAMESVHTWASSNLSFAIPQTTLAKIENWVRDELTNRVHKKTR